MKIHFSPQNHTKILDYFDRMCNIYLILIIMLHLVSHSLQHIKSTYNALRTLHSNTWQ